MTNFINNELKHLILQKVGMHKISPSDCQIIAIEINKKLNKTISETTIKRLFGFASTNHQFSKFTINTLLEFVEGENEILNKLVNKSNKVENQDWKYLVLKAKQFSENTVKSIAKKTSITYSATINRKFAEYDFDFFYNSDYTFTSYISIAGCGKSVLLNHLVEDLFINQHSKYHSDIVLYAQAATIFKASKDNIDLSSVLLKLLGLSTELNFVDYFNAEYNKHGKKIIIILDGFYDIFKNNDVKPYVFNSLLKFLCELQESDAIKVIISMRTYIWKRFFETIRHANYLKNKWFKGSYYRATEQTNIPFFTTAEVDTLLNKIDPIILSKIPSSVKHELKNAFLLSYYHDLRNDFKEVEYKSDIILYAITLKYLYDKIYEINHSVEKLILCKQLVLLSKYDLNRHRIRKTLLIKEFNIFRNAYMDLLVNGVIVEEQVIENGFPTEYVKFLHPLFFNYFLFKEVSEFHEYKFNSVYFNDIITSYHNNGSHLDLLKWSIYHFVKENDFTNLNFIFEINLTTDEINELLLFLADAIHRKLETEPDVIKDLKEINFTKNIIQQFLYLDFLNSKYYHCLTVFSKITATPDDYAFFQTALILHDCINLNISQLKNRITYLSQTNYDHNNWIIDPAVIANFLLLKLNNHHIDNHPLFSKIDLFADSTEEFEINETNSLNNQLILFIIANISWFYNSPKNTIAIISYINTLYPISGYRSKTISNYLIHILGVAVNKIEPNKKTKQLERILFHIHNQPNAPTSSLAKSVYNLILAQKYTRKNIYELAIKHASKALEKFNEDNYVIFEIITYSLLIKIYKELDDIDKMNEYKYMLINILDKKNINMHSLQLPNYFSPNDKLISLN